MNMLRTMAVAALLIAAGPSSQALAQCVSGQEGGSSSNRGRSCRSRRRCGAPAISRDQLAGDPQLCQAGGGYVYRVRVYQDGQVTAVNIPAN